MGLRFFLRSGGGGKIDVSPTQWVFPRKAPSSALGFLTTGMEESVGEQETA